MAGQLFKHHAPYWLYWICGSLQVIGAPSKEAPQYIQQSSETEKHGCELGLRNVSVVTVLGDATVSLQHCIPGRPDSLELTGMLSVKCSAEGCPVCSSQRRTPVNSRALRNPPTRSLSRSCVGSTPCWRRPSAWC